MRQELSQYLSHLEHVRNRRPGTIQNHKKVINKFFDYLEERKERFRKSVRGLFNIH